MHEEHSEQMGEGSRGEQTRCAARLGRSPRRDVGGVRVRGGQRPLYSSGGSSVLTQHFNTSTEHKGVEDGPEEEGGRIKWSILGFEVCGLRPMVVAGGANGALVGLQELNKAAGTPGRTAFVPGASLKGSTTLAAAFRGTGATEHLTKVVIHHFVFNLLRVEEKGLSDPQLAIHRLVLCPNQLQVTLRLTTCPSSRPESAMIFLPSYITTL
ncbi:hypothetical protein EYF80_026503 [Liparis tanakae]|uniref:Uncharacterized protein n=1 Tax=Liparis tanakae TaxID=230148 RepID=A0A4Z2HEP0_9TELE|nr:hypothetical protein EYF80_026503 [Liparis tanakae]